MKLVILKTKNKDFCIDISKTIGIKNITKFVVWSVVRVPIVPSTGAPSEQINPAFIIFFNQAVVTLGSVRIHRA